MFYIVCNQVCIEKKNSQISSKDIMVAVALKVIQLVPDNSVWVDWIFPSWSVFLR